MARHSADMEKEPETNETLKGHKIVQTCHHVQELGTTPTRHNQDDNLVCAECILDFFMAMGRGKDEGKSQEEIILEYALGGSNIFYLFRLFKQISRFGKIEVNRHNLLILATIVVILIWQLKFLNH